MIMNERELLIRGIVELEFAIRDEKEKIKLNRKFGINHYNSMAEENIQVYENIIKILKKQIPMKVEIKEWSPAVCPSCGYELSTHHGDGYFTHPTFLKRCPNPDCCQRLDWRE